MGRLIKNHLARLIVMTAAVYQITAGIHGYWWPKIFWDTWTQSLNSLVRPLPLLQTLNVLMGFLTLAWEYPMPFLIPNSAFHRSIAARLAIYPVSVLIAVLNYQGTNAALYYLIGIAVYFWAYSEGETVCMPWKVPERKRGVGNSRV